MLGIWRFTDLDKWCKEGWSDEKPIKYAWDSDEEEDNDDEEPTKVIISSNPASSKATDNDVLSRLASLGHEEYVSEQDGEDGDDEVSATSSGSELTWTHALLSVRMARTNTYHTRRISWRWKGLGGNSS